MEFNSPKISLDKSWKFTPQVLFLIILGIVVILGVLILAWYLIKISPPPPPISPSVPPAEEGNVQMPEGPVDGMWGTVIAIEPIITEDEAFIGKAATLRVDALGQEYVIHMLDDIVINKYQIGAESSPPSLLEEDIGWQVIEVGDHVYVAIKPGVAELISFPQTTTLFSASIESIDIYR